MDWSYVAGFIDGEGSIIIKPPRIRILISNTNKDVLDKIKDFVNCGKVYEVNMDKRKNNWARQYKWAICSHQDVLIILKNLKDKLLIKKELCDEAINYIENKRWQRYYLSKEELEKLRHLGSSRKIAKQLGVSQFSVLKYMKKYGMFPI